MIITEFNDNYCNDRKTGKSKYEHKLTELDVVTMQIQYSVNGVWAWIVTEMDRKLVVICDVFSVLTAFKPSCKL